MHNEFLLCIILHVDVGVEERKAADGVEFTDPLHEATRRVRHHWIILF